MAFLDVNGVTLHYELKGTGEPLVLVHGAWTDLGEWNRIVDDLASTFTVLTYDRRGHSRSERPAGQGSMDEDGDDLAALLTALDMAPAHVVTNSGGGVVALRLAARRQALFRSLICHETPLFDLLGGERAAVMPESLQQMAEVNRLLAAGENEQGARLFVDIAFGQGFWRLLPMAMKETFIFNAPTFLDELNDGQLNLDEAAISRLTRPLHLTDGSKSQARFAAVNARLVELVPHATRETIVGAGHVPQLTAPAAYVDSIRRAIAAVPRT
jgi:pimeloyl-ACP methyl ester carboxylesterase